MADNVSYKLDTVKMDVMQRALQSGFPLQMAIWGGAQLEARGKRNVPVDLGTTQGSIYFWTQKGAGWASAHCGPTTSYSLGLEEGTPPHEIKSRNKKALYWKGAAHPVKKVWHPGTRPYHYMRRALMSLKTPFVQAISAGLKRFA